jgi:predicted AAA+ superfamily ATPase
MPAINREILKNLILRMESDSVTLVEGPRSVGKSTLLTEIAEKNNVKVLNFDTPSVLAAVEKDPGFFVSGQRPVVIDEYQKLPELLDWIKSELNSDSSPGRFILAGSTNFLSLPKGTQSLTGRLARIKVEPFAQAELEGTPAPKISGLINPEWFRSRAIGQTSREQYLEKVLQGSFPIALQKRSAEDRFRWADDYLESVLGRDLEDLVKIRNKNALRRVLELLAARSGQTLNLQNLAEAAGINRLTADSYLELLNSVFTTQELPAWGTTLGSRTNKRPRVHLADSLLQARLMRVNKELLEKRTPSALTQFGQILETFVVAELRKLLSFETQGSLYGHWRESESQEVDFVVEDESGMVTGFEIKASSSVGKNDANGLLAMSEKLGSRFAGGTVIYLGEHAYPIEGNIYALPLDALWA